MGGDFINKHISKLFNYTCDIYKFKNTISEPSKETIGEFILDKYNVPCRVSKVSRAYTLSTPKEGHNFFIANKYVKIFLNKGITVLPNSKIIVYGENYSITYSHTSIPLIYSNHQEILAIHSTTV